MDGVILNNQFRSFYQTEPGHAEFLKTVEDIAAAIKAMPPLPGRQLGEPIKAYAYGYQWQPTRGYLDLVTSEAIMARAGDRSVVVEPVGEVGKWQWTGFQNDRDTGSSGYMLSSREDAMREGADWLNNRLGKSIALPFAKSCLAYCIAAIENDTAGIKATQAEITAMKMLSDEALSVLEFMRSQRRPVTFDDIIIQAGTSGRIIHDLERSGHIQIATGSQGRYELTSVGLRVMSAYGKSAKNWLHLITSDIATTGQISQALQIINRSPIARLRQQQEVARLKMPNAMRGENIEYERLGQQWQDEYDRVLSQLQGIGLSYEDAQTILVTADRRDYKSIADSLALVTQAQAQLAQGRPATELLPNLKAALRAMSSDPMPAPPLYQAPAPPDPAALSVALADGSLVKAVMDHLSK